MPSDMPRETEEVSTQAESGDLSGITEMFGLQDGQGDTGTHADADTAGRWESVTEGTGYGSNDASGRLVQGRYRLIAELGAGGMGVTYRAWDTQAGIPVVVKMPKREVRHDRSAITRFSREIEAMRAVPHPSIVPITDFGDDEGCPFVAMRFLPGGSLADYRRRDESDRPIKNPPGMLFFWLPGTAEAIDHIHARRMLHRDVKPGNIFLDGFLRSYLGDFGIAKVVDDSGGLQKEQTLTGTKIAIGTPEYMAPELFKPRSQLDGRADQYALAVTVYEMLCGEKPFTGSTAHIIVEHSSLPVPPLERHCPGLPRSLYEAVHRALSKKPDERFATCGEFAEAALVDLKPLEPEADTVRLLCPSCKNILKLPNRAAGKSGKCPRCQASMDVASDLGSLWLESEERGGGLAVIGGMATPSQPLEKPEEPELRPAPATEARRAFPWAAVAAAVVASLIVGYFGGSNSERLRLSQQRAKLESRSPIKASGASQLRMNTAGKIEELEQRVQDRDKTIADMEKVKAERESLAAENERLAKDVASARAAIVPEAFPPASSTTGTSGPAPAVPPSIETLTNSIGIRFNLCRSGSFTMGYANGLGAESPPHAVAITKPFYIGIFEVTNAQWKQVMGSVPSKWKEDAHPVEQVSWEEAVEFCRKLSALPEERNAGRVYRLPTEAEWEYACRAGTTTKFSFGDDEKLFGDYGWFGDNSGKQTHPVGQKEPNAWGLYDMHGNVLEWCSDWNGIYPDGEVTNPQGPSSGSDRVVRGGCWLSSAWICRSALRYWDDPSRRIYSLGFRLALSPSGAESPEADK